MNYGFNKFLKLKKKKKSGIKGLVVLQISVATSCYNRHSLNNKLRDIIFFFF